jgi:hypothetical protein
MSFSEMLDESNKPGGEIHEDPIVRKTPKMVTWHCVLAAFAGQANDGVRLNMDACEHTHGGEGKREAPERGTDRGAGLPAPVPLTAGTYRKRDVTGPGESKCLLRRQRNGRGMLQDTAACRHAKVIALGGGRCGRWILSPSAPARPGHA